jgi:phosphate-induced protein 1
VKGACVNSFRVSANRVCFILLLVLLGTSPASAQYAKDDHHLEPTGKGWAQERGYAPLTFLQGAGINWHGGSIMPGTVHIYYIWYGNWQNGPKPSDSLSTVNLLNDLFAATGGMGGSGYARINTTYGDGLSNATGNMVLAGSIKRKYPRGTQLTDTSVRQLVSNALKRGKLPIDANGVYFVLTSSDVSQISDDAQVGFCSNYCGWHSRTTILGTDIKYAFVGNPDRCPFACEAQTISPNNNSGADGMASIMAHEAEEALTDPDLNAWFDFFGDENADKCAWKFGPTTGTIGKGAYNQTFGSHHWLIQMNWENSRGSGGCVQTLGGPFYTK